MGEEMRRQIGRRTAVFVSPLWPLWRAGAQRAPLEQMARRGEKSRRCINTLGQCLSQRHTGAPPVQSSAVALQLVSSFTCLAPFLPNTRRTQSPNWPPARFINLPVSRPAGDEMAPPCSTMVRRIWRLEASVSPTSCGASPRSSAATLPASWRAAPSGAHSNGECGARVAICSILSVSRVVGSSEL